MKSSEITDKRLTAAQEAERGENQALKRENQLLEAQLIDRLNDPLYRGCAHFFAIFSFKSVRYHLKELVKCILSPKQQNALGRIREKTRPVIDKIPRISGLYGKIIPNEAPKRWYRQKPWQGPLLSIIIPCYNHGRYLEQLVPRLQKQSYPAFEMIIVDDGSEDEASLAAMQRLEDKAISNLRILRQDHQGVVAARNRAAWLASGKYLFPLDADDTIDKSFVEKALLTLEASGPHCFVYPWSQVSGQSDFVLKNKPTHPLSVLHKNLIQGPVIPKWLFQMAGGYHPGMNRGYEDWELYVNLVKHGAVGKVIPEILYHYRQSPGSRDETARGRYEILRHRIQYRHQAEIHQSIARLKRIHRQRCCVANPLINLLARSTPPSPGSAWLVDLHPFGKKGLAMVSSVFSLARNHPDKRILVVAGSGTQKTFERHPLSNLYVYYPEYYFGPENRRRIYEYLYRRYAPRTISPDPIR